MKLHSLSDDVKLEIFSFFKPSTTTLHLMLSNKENSRLMEREYLWKRYSIHAFGEDFVKKQGKENEDWKKFYREHSEKLKSQ